MPNLPEADSRIIRDPKRGDGAGRARLLGFFLGMFIIIFGFVHAKFKYIR
jgi:hypothetical protein